MIPPHRWIAPLVVVAVVSGLVGCSQDGGAEDRAHAPGTGALVITDDNGRVVMIDPTGVGAEEPVELAGPGGERVIVQATPSPDGSLVVWTDMSNGEPQLALHDIGDEGEGVRRTPVPTAPFFYMFSPDATHLAALGNDPGGEGVGLLMIDPASGDATAVDVGQPYYVAWRPDSSGLAAHIGTDLVTLVDTAGNRADVGIDGGAFQAPEWVDQDHVLAVTQTPGQTAALSSAGLQLENSSLVVVDVNDASTRVLSDVGSVTTFEMSPAGDLVAYVEGAGGGGTALGPLAVADLEGSQPAIEIEGGDVVAFEWSRDGSRLLYMTLEAEAGFVPHVWDGDAVSSFEGFLPTPTFLTQYLPFWSQYTRTISQWASDGSAFAYSATGDDGVGAIWVQPLDGDRQEVADGEMVVWSP